MKNIPSMISCARVAVLTACLGLGACVHPPGTADAVLLHRVDTVMRQATPAITVGLKLSAEQFRTGEAIAAEVTSTTAGYVYLFQMGTDGHTLSLVFPNAMDGANYIAANTPLGLPRPNWRMAARGPAGVGHMLAVVTEKPLDLMALQAHIQARQFEIQAPYGAAMATVREVAP